MSGVVLRLEGLPFKVTSDELNDFFTESEAKITHTHLLLNRDGRPSGIGYIELDSEADVKLALTLDGKCIGEYKRYVRMGKFTYVLSLETIFFLSLEGHGLNNCFSELSFCYNLYLFV